MNIQEIASASAMLKAELMPIFDKIGQGTEWGYGIFMKQAYVNALIVALWVVPGVICLILAIIISKNLTRWVEGDTEAEEVLGILALICFVGGLLMVLLPIPGLIQVLINPDYATIKLIIETAKGIN